MNMISYNTRIIVNFKEMFPPQQVKVNQFGVDVNHNASPAWILT